MPKKQKLDKRLNQLFKDTQPEVTPSKRKRNRVTEEAAAPLPESSTAKEITSKTGPLSVEPVSATRPVKRHTAALPHLEMTKMGPRQMTGSRMALAFQAGQEEWATLQVMDEAASRVWSQDEQLLVKQVADQLSLALENARLFKETQDRAAELSKRAIQLKAVADISAAVSTILNPQELLQASVNLIRQRFELYHCHIFMLTEDGKSLNVEACGWEEGDPRSGTHGVREINIDQEVSLVARAARTRRAVIVNDVTTAPDWLPNPNLPRVISEMAVPVIAKDRLLGILNVHSDKLNFFSDEDISIQTTLASQIAVAIDNARLFNETEKHSREIELLHRIASRVASSLDIQGNLQFIAEELAAAFNLGHVGITLLNEDRTALTVVADAPAPPDTTSPDIGIVIPMAGNEATQRIVNERMVLIAEDVPHNPDMDPIRETMNHRRTETLYVFPLIAGEEVIGTVGLDILQKGRTLQKDEIRLAENILLQASTAISSSRLFHRTEQSEAELRALFGAMPDVIIVYDREGRYVRVAPTNPERLFRPPDELIGKKISEVLPEGLHQTFMNAIQGALAGSEPVKIEYPMTISGQEIWFDASVTKLSHDRVFWVARDISERKKAEDAIQKRNTYLSVSSEIGRVITSTLDLNTIFSRAVNLINERFGFYHAAIFIVEETGFNAILREATGEAGAQMKRDRHTLAVDSKSIVGQVTAHGTSIVVNNTTLDPLHKKNPLLPETKAEAAIPLRVGNRVIGALDIQSTIVEAFTEDEINVLQTLADQVAVAIDNARSYELSQQAVMEMREIDRLKSQFLANMSHELRTPLNSIIGFSRVILKGIDGPVTELQQQDLTAIYNSGQHLLGLINDILDLSKIEAGKMELAFDEVNMTDVTNSVLSTMTGLIKDKPVTLKRVIQPDLPTVRADAIRVRQVMINLLSNAAKFTEEGEILVEVAVKPGLTGRPEMMVSVTDTGPGIDPQDQNKLFQPFSQVDDSPTRKTGGTGLGLSICQHLIQMHGGRIGIHSSIGKGSTFYFTLPLYRKEKEVETPGRNGKVILAIDDDPQVIGLYERYLQPQGYQVISLTDPSRAVERVRQLKPFAVTLDIMMPGIDGWQVLNNLKSDPETREVPVIICSIIEDLEKGFSLGAADYLVKPILEEDLVNALDRLNADGSIREVLVIDDDPNDLRLIGKMLTDDGRYKPTLAQGGLQGWEIISSKNPPHAVILDLFMPELDGFKIIENMRADEKLRDIPLIVISGMDLTLEQKKLLDDFGQRLITKGSFNEKELFTTIQRSLQRMPDK